MKTDTIAAIATALTPSGIGIIRISGEDSLAIINCIFYGKTKKKELKREDTHRVFYGYIKDGEETIDEVMVLLMMAPNSFTKEDTVEIDCHGGVYVMKRILETVIKYGARPAEPGEFTKRAFLNGRIDLTQAESVIDIINAKNEFALANSIKQLKGSVVHEVKEIRQNILHEIAFIESALDDPEHISLDGFHEHLNDMIVDNSSRIKRLVDTSENGRMLKEGLMTVIVGKPNVGKSSLLNALVGDERAIVTDIAGTTRDVLEEQIQLHGISLNIIDTAGIRDTEDVVEKIGVKKAKEYAGQSDLTIYVIDASSPLDKNDEEIMELLDFDRTITLLNKSDLDSAITVEDVKKKVSGPVLSISAKEHKGIEDLEDAIKDMFFQGDISFNDEVVITNIRHKTSLQEAFDSLNLVLRSIEDHMPEDFYSIDLMSAYTSLGNVIGESVEDDLVQEIFSKFCMGK